MRIFDVRGEEDGAGAGAENGAALGGELADGVEETFFLEELELRGAFAAGEDEGVGMAEIGDGADLEGLHAESLESGGVCGEVALDGEDADGHGDVISYQFLVLRAGMAEKNIGQANPRPTRELGVWGTQKQSEGPTL